jgi:hypothetical protein
MPNVSLLYDILEADKDIIESLNLSGIADASIVIRKLPLDRRLGPQVGDVDLPAILLCPDQDRMDPLAGPIGVNEIVFGVLCVFVAADNQSLTANMDLFASHRESIVGAFHNQRLQGVSEVVNGWVEPREILNQEAWKNNLHSSALVLKHQAWIER